MNAGVARLPVLSAVNQFWFIITIPFLQTPLLKLSGCETWKINVLDRLQPTEQAQGTWHMAHGIVPF